MRFAITEPSKAEARASLYMKLLEAPIVCAILGGAFIATLPIVLIFVAGRNQILDNLTIGAVKQ